MLFAAGASSIKELDIAYCAFAQIDKPKKIIVAKANGFEGSVITWAFYNGIECEVRLAATNDYFDQQNLDREIIFDVDVTDVLIVTAQHQSPRIRYVHDHAWNKGIKVSRFSIKELINGQKRIVI